MKITTEDLFERGLALGAGGDVLQVPSIARVAVVEGPERREADMRVRHRGSTLAPTERARARRSCRSYQSYQSYQS